MTGDSIAALRNVMNKLPATVSFKIGKEEFSHPKDALHRLEGVVTREDKPQVAEKIIYNLKSYAQLIENNPRKGTMTITLQDLTQDIPLKKGETEAKKISANVQNLRDTQKEIASAHREITQDADKTSRRDLGIGAPSDLKKSDDANAIAFMVNSILGRV